MQEYIEHTDKSYNRTIARLRADGEDYAALLTERLWAAQKVIKELQAAVQKPCDCKDSVYVCQDCGYIWHV